MASVTPAAQVLSKAGRTFTLHEYAHQEPGKEGVGFGDEAALALGVDPARLFKTLVVDAADRACGGRCSRRRNAGPQGDGAAVQAKSVRMAHTADAERATGYVVGGISPLGQRKRLTTVVDESAPAGPQSSSAPDVGGCRWSSIQEIWWS